MLQFLVLQGQHDVLVFQLLVLDSQHLFLPVFLRPCHCSLCWVGEVRQLKHACTLLLFQLLPTQHQLRPRFVVKLRGNVQALSLGQFVARSGLTLCIIVSGQSKFGLANFFPACLHVTDVSHKMSMVFSRQLGNLQTAHRLPALSKFNKLCVHSSSCLSLLNPCYTDRARRIIALDGPLALLLVL